MDNLPNELLIYLSSWLRKNDLKSFRLCSRIHADAGKTALFKDFEFQLWPNHHRIYQLELLAANQGIASQLKRLSFQSGILLEYADYRYWQAQVYKEISSEWISSRNGRSGSKEEYEAFHTALQARFHPGMQIKYNLYRWHLDQEAALVAAASTRKQIVRAMNALSNEHSSIALQLTMVEPQVKLEDVEHFNPLHYQHEQPEDPDPRRRVANRRQNTLNHFVNFLVAAQESQLEVRDLTLTDIPQQLLLSHWESTFSDLMPAFFAKLIRLDIKMSTLPHSDWLSRSGTEPIYHNGRNVAARRLRMLLDCATSLESLRLEFPSDKEAEYSFDIFDRTNIHRFPRKFLPGLKNLELCRFRCTWEDLKALLEEAHQLKCLTLSHCRLETYSMVDLIRAMPTLKLDVVSLLGMWYVDQDGGSWHSHVEDDFTGCNGATSFEGPYLHNGMKRFIEEYMLTGGPICPLPEWAPIDGVSCPWDLLGDTSWHFIQEAPP